MIEKPKVEEVYLKGIVTGDAKIIRSIYEKYHKAIIDLVKKNGGTKEDARDVFQEALMLIYQKMKKEEIELSSSFFTYFYGCCLNIWRNKRKKKYNSELSLTEEMQSVLVDVSVPEIEENEQYVFYRRKFALLGDDCKKLLQLFLQKVKMEEIMRRMNFSSVNYVKQKKFKCKAKLIKLIENDPAYHELKN